MHNSETNFTKKKRKLSKKKGNSMMMEKGDGLHIPLDGNSVAFAVHSVQIMFGDSCVLFRLFPQWDGTYASGIPSERTRIGFQQKRTTSSGWNTASSSSSKKWWSSFSFCSSCFCFNCTRSKKEQRTRWCGSRCHGNGSIDVQSP